jgi:hypothetical protein
MNTAAAETTPDILAPGAAGWIRDYQFIDPLRGRVPLEQRVDLTQHRKINGQHTYLPMPTEMPALVGFPEAFVYSQAHADFYKYCKERELYTLAFSFDTLAALYSTDESTLEELAIELYPSESLTFLARAHGRQSTYVAGCRGPLCKTANTVAQRIRYDSIPANRQKLESDKRMNQIGNSYAAYIQYCKYLLKFRRRQFNEGDEGRRWKPISLRDTVLLDVTEEKI